MAHNIEAEIQAPPDALPGQEVTVYVTVQDVTEADAPARQVAQAVLQNVRLSPGGTLHATISVPEPDLQPNASYSVRVHADTTGNAKVTPGDYVSTQSHPVLTHGHSNRVSVPLRRVR